MAKNWINYTDFKHRRQRIRHFSGDNEIADLDITATENGQKTVIIFIISEIVPSCQGF